MQRPPRWLAGFLLIATALLAGCASGGGAGSDVMLIRGELTYRTRVALPRESVAVVELTRPQDGRVLAEQRIALEGRQVPIAFELRVRRADLADGTGYALRGTIEARGGPTWITDPVDVRAGRGVASVGTLVLRPYERTAFASRLECGQRTARVGTVRVGDGEVLRLVVGNERYELRRVVSASGARYEAIYDPTTQLWDKGERALLTLRGEVLPECTVTHDAPDAVTARGNEPGWQLALGTALRFTSDGERVEGTAPPAQYTGSVRRHVGTVGGRSVYITLTPRICRDTMADMPYPFTAEVIISGRTFRGCGGEPDTLLMGSEWVVEDIGGTLIDRSRATLDFGVDGRLGGRASCNAFTTSYTLTGEGLTIGTTATTMNSCAPALMEQEKRFLDILQRVRRFDIMEDGALLLQDDQRRRIIARRERA
ncbi:MAG: META domain-containing protein [Burkholderiaceae bacterium]